MMEEPEIAPTRSVTGLGKRQRAACWRSSRRRGCWNSNGAHHLLRGG
ncbi:hypothetical protein [Tsukamurella sp. 1534]